MRIPALFVSAASGLLLAPAIGQAQATWSGTATFASAYVWRGLTTTNRPVVQPEVGLDVPWRGTTLTFGAWASIEPARYDGASDISAVYGMLPGPAFTQYSAWAHFAAEFPGISLSGGAETYLYPTVAGLAADYNTVEVTISASLALPLSPTFTAWYDVHAISGAYVETSLWLDRSILGRTYNFSLTGGFNAGQGADGDPTHRSYFARNGLTHLALTATTDWNVGAMTLSPSANLIHAVDPMARVIAPARERSIKLWLGSAISWRSRAGGSE